MKTHKSARTLTLPLCLLPLGMGLAVETPSMALPPAIAAAPAAMQQQTAPTGEPEGILGGELFIPPNRLSFHVPDPEVAAKNAHEELDRAREADDKAAVNFQNRVLERIGTIRREDRMHLTLEDAIRRTLANNYTIDIMRYNPAIESTRVVEAEAAFDALFFTNVIKNNVDRPTGSELMSTDLDFFQLSTGVRKLLASGMQVGGRYELERTKQAFVFQQINPEYVSRFVLEMRQPMLRNFGIDFNRSLILVAKHDRRIGDLTFRRQIRDTLRQVEEMYWRLVQVRRDVVITARLLAEFEAIYEWLVARQAFDITPVQIAAAKADLEQAKADFVIRRAGVFNAEDRLIAVMNDPDVNLTGGMELLPDDFPQLQRIVVDQLGEVQTALDNRTEIKEQELQIAKAKIGVGRAVNAALPRVDLTFRVTHTGLSGTADRSFDELSRRKYIEYFVGVELEVPIGNRGPRAAHRRAELLHSQAVAGLRRAFEDVILDVNLATRRLDTAFDAIGPSFESAEARDREVESIQARAERKDHNTLINELGAQQRLANIRRSMLNAMVEYNIAIVDLERAKGTLLEYNNVIVPTEVD